MNLKKCLFSFLLLTVLFVPRFAYTQTWQQLTDFPSHHRDDGTYFIIGSKAYCGTGLTSWWAPCADFYSFDINTELWNTVASLPTGDERQYALGFANLNSGYVFGGINGSTYLNDLWKYDTLNNSWTEIDSLPSDGRSGSSGFVIGDKAYIIGGRNAISTSLSELWAYDMTNNSWIAKNDLPFGGRWRASAASTNNKGYLIFGADENDIYRNELYEYGPQNDSWTQISSFPLEGRIYSSMNAIGDKLYITFGMDSLGTYYNDQWEFDITSATWHQINSLPSAGRKGGMCFSDNYNIYYTTGITQADVPLKETWKVSGLNSINESSFNVFRIYPNPFIETLTIELNEPIINSDFEVYDALGKMILNGEIHSEKTTIDLSNAPNGFYFLNIIIDDKSSNYKLINY